MKAKTDKKEKEFDTVKTIRVIKENISNEIADMNYMQLKEYLQKNSVQHSK